MQGDLRPPTDAATERYVDPVIEAYKRDVDRTLIRHALRMTVEQRLASLEQCLKDLSDLRQAAITATKR